MYLESQGYMPDFVVLLQPTFPLRQVKHIDEAIEKILSLTETPFLSKFIPETPISFGTYLSYATLYPSCLLTLLILDVQVF
ncbi:MAG: hypothetical protein AB1414_02690 [bacterium]